MSKFSTIAFNHKLPEYFFMLRLKELIFPLGTKAAVMTHF